ncbi:hypothetical protein MPSEU_000434800 [Mayamaea pseudoterrestris]|nr:hypothetical protein MPSEU_000434800 [Mayamaea pseudoterrestris]
MHSIADTLRLERSDCAEHFVRTKRCATVNVGQSLARFSILSLLIKMLAIALQRRSVAAFTRPSFKRPIVRASVSSHPRVFLSSLNSSKDSPDDKQRKPKKKSSIKNFKIVDQVTDEHINKLAAAFDELAKKEGFDNSNAFFADDATFDEPFGDDADFDDDEDNMDENDEEDDDIIASFAHDADGDMDARIAAASRDLVGIVKDKKPVVKGLTFDNMKEIGFRKERNPYGNDETPRKVSYAVLTNAMSCPACGADFQSADEGRPGFLPLEKYELQVKLSKLEEIRKLDEKAATADWTTEDEVKWLMQTTGSASVEDVTSSSGIAFDDAATELEVDLDSLSTKKKTICKRCHGLQNYGTVENVLRPGWTDEPLLSQENFRKLLDPLSEKPAVILALIDLFDFTGSILPELDEIAGDNPVILVANKVDLLPSAMGFVRAENWVRRELEYYGVRSLANIGGAVQLVSCKTGFGMDKMMAKARSLAADMNCDIYLVGAANAGKSTLLNRIVDWRSSDDQEPVKKRAGNRNMRKGSVTTSPLPGTTLKFIEVDLGDGQKIIDTPGLLVNGTLTQLLTPEELKVVVPQRKVEPITFRVVAGKCVLIGGLARVEVIGDSKPFLFTFFVANQIKLHPTDASRADDFILAHAGGMLTPPLSPGPERMEALGKFEEHVLTIDGMGWKEAAADISLTGLGWVAVTGVGQATVKISVPKGIGVSVRPPLMPFDIWESAASYTGSRAVRKVSRKGGGKRRKGVGRN